MRDLLLGLVGIVGVLGDVPYIVDTARGRSKPNIASWSTWTLINATAVIAALAAGGALNTVIVALSYLVGSFTILVLGLFRGTRGYTAFDVLCQALALVGLVLWWLSNDPNIALAFAVAADIFAAMPTLKHAYYHPSEETWATYILAAIAGLGALCLVSSWTFAALAIPADYFLLDAFLGAVILLRRRAVPGVA